MSPKGWVLLDERGSDFSGASLRNVVTGESRELVSFGDKADSAQVSGDASNDFAIIKVMPSYIAPETFTMYGYDIAGDKLWTITKNTVDAEGNPMPATWDRPEISGEHAAFVLATGPDALRTLYVVDRRTRKTSAALTEKGLLGVHRAEEGFLVVHADHRRTLLDPETLAESRDPEISRLDGTLWLTLGPHGSLAHVGGGEDYNEVWYTPDRRKEKPRKLAEFGTGVLQDAPELGAHTMLLFLNGLGTYAMDLTTGHTSRLTKALGGAAAQSDLYLVPKPPPGSIKESATTGILWTLGPGKLTGPCSPRLRGS